MIIPHRNPYIIGRPIDERDFFVGRKSLFRFIEDNLRRGEQVILLHGQRRIGKSSIIRKIPKFVDVDGFVFVPFDLEYHSQAPLPRILAALAQEIVEHLQLRIDKIAPPEILELESDLEIFYHKFLPQVYQELSGKNLVLLLDEFDVLDNNESESLVEEFFVFLESILKQDHKLFIISFLERQSVNIQNLIGILNNAPITEIGLLDKESVKVLITKPSEGILEYEPDAIQAIFKLSAGHPYFTQVICFAIFGRAREKDNWKVSSDDVEAIVDRAIELAEAGLSWFWDGLSNLEKVVFSAAAEVQKIAYEQVKNIPKDPLSLIKKSGITVNNELIQATEQLVKSGLLDDALHVKIELVRRWLVQRYPLRQVIQEINELDKFAEKKTRLSDEIQPQLHNHSQIQNSRRENHKPTVYNDTYVMESNNNFPSFSAEISWSKPSYLALKSSETKQQKQPNFLLLITQNIQSKPKSLIWVAIALISAMSSMVGLSVYRLSSPCLASEKKVLGILCVADPSINISRGDRTFFLTNPNTNRDLGIAAFKKGDYTAASELFKKAVAANRNDPEVLIYYNNAQARQNPPVINLAVVVPVDNAQGKAQEMLRGVALAQDQFNKEKGLNGRLLEIAIANDGDLQTDKQTEKSQQIAEKLINDQSVLGVIGHNASESTQAALSKYENANPKLAVISPTSSSTDLKSEVFFRTVPSNAAYAQKLAEYAMQSGLKKVVIFSNSDSQYSRSLRENFQENFKQLGGQVLENGTSTELNDNLQLDKFASQVQAAVLFPDTNHIPQSLTIAKANTQKFNQKLKLLGGDTLYSRDTLTAGGTAVQGLVLAIPSVTSKKFAEAAQKQWGAKVNWRTASSYDATWAFIQAIKAASTNLNRENVLLALRQVNLSPSRTSGLALKFTPEGERQSKPILVEVKGAKFTIVPSVKSQVTPLKSP